MPGFLVHTVSHTVFTLQWGTEEFNANCKVFALSRKQPTSHLLPAVQGSPKLDQTLAANNYSSSPFHSPGGFMLLLLSAKQYLAPCKSMKNLHKEREMRPLTYIHILVLLAVLQKIRSLYQGEGQCVPQRVTVTEGTARGVADHKREGINLVWVALKQKLAPRLGEAAGTRPSQSFNTHL